MNATLAAYGRSIARARRPSSVLLGRIARTAAVAAALTLLLHLSPATSRGSLPQASGAQSLLVDPSVRAGGMGRASSAVFWGNVPNPWSNPALLSYNSGIRYEWGKTQLVPDLSDEVFFTTKRLTAGYWGLGLQLAGKPFGGVGGSNLDYGSTVATDADGNPLGSFRSYEDIESVAGALSALVFTEHLLGALGRDAPRLSRFGDVSVGWAEKKTHVVLTPAFVTLDRRAGEGTTTTHDSGILFRFTPYNAIDYGGWISGLDRLARLRVDVSYARSTLNYDDATISYLDEDQSDPVLRTHRTGWAAHAAIGLSSGSLRALERRGLGWLPGWISPLVRWGKAWDREIPMIRDKTTDAHVLGTEIKDTGWELTFANIYSIRRGRIEDPEGEIVGPTSGWSLGLQVRDLAGFSYDRATVPQSIYLGPVDRKAMTFFINPVRVWAALKD